MAVRVVSTFFDPCVADESTFLEHTPPSSSGGEGEAEGGAVAAASSSSSSSSSSSPSPHQHHHHHHQWALAPSLTPASQPTISLLTDGSASDTLGVESLTLLPPAASALLHPTPLPLGPPSSITEEEEEEEEQEQEEEPEGPGDDATIPLADFLEAQLTAAGGPQETTEEEDDEEEEAHSQTTDTLDSPELD